ncbi:MAG: DUF4430 domain-containing protein [Firmicutes bacterium]|nr:DUF4430 domain-containing protein [Bacillota bacterium]
MKNRKTLVLLALVLVIALAFAMTGCKKKAPEATGAKFTFEAYDLNGGVKSFELTAKEDEDNVGAVLVREGLVSGDDSQYGLYVKTVNGITLDYDKDQMYWAFYINGEYAMTGVDSTPIEEGAVYAFKPEK